jgi:CheY-like chemotaxis protein
MCGILRDAGCAVFDVGSPIGVTKAIVDNQIDVIVLDVMMPEISGDKLAKLLRSNPRMHQLSIILVSSADAARLSQIASDVKAEAVVPKADIHRELRHVVLETHRRKLVTRTSRR